MDEHRKEGLLQRILSTIKGKAGGRQGSRKANLEQMQREERVEHELEQTYDPGEQTVRDRTAFRQ